ncbi:hypothetical protein OIE66_28010 [Nonomuraea sp. NBC_01738]|uniref:hypothetical protein n=1 Tax=Nonomuraea sp. NBC_01738 TaxID=2976003 RepID=UPI002E14F490|nr:hypothetical protein OIE66_28010 [Nonomuraea sp. NBC_01738]
MKRTAVMLGCAWVVLVGCGPLSTTHHNPGSSHEVATTSPTAVSGEVRVAITIARGEVSPPSGWVEIKKGAAVALTVTSDVADEVHVHGYDVEADLPAGQATTLRFTADQSGVFEVETHENKLVLTQLAVK